MFLRKNFMAISGWLNPWEIEAYEKNKIWELYLNSVTIYKALVGLQTDYGHAITKWRQDLNKLIK